jgi:hypothetical protein
MHTVEVGGILHNISNIRLFIRNLFIGSQAELVVDCTDTLGTEEEENLSENVFGGCSCEIHGVDKSGR